MANRVHNGDLEREQLGTLAPPTCLTDDFVRKKLTRTSHESSHSTVCKRNSANKEPILVGARWESTGAKLTAIPQLRDNNTRLPSTTSGSRASTHFQRTGTVFHRNSSKLYCIGISNSVRLSQPCGPLARDRPLDAFVIRPAAHVCVRLLPTGLVSRVPDRL
jgi:hypothetical protein